MYQFEKRFDFGTAKSPVEPDFQRVSERTKYSPALGYGWTAGTVSSVDRGSGTALDRDLSLLQKGTFVVDLPNGTYRVELLFDVANSPSLNAFQRARILERLKGYIDGEGVLQEKGREAVVAARAADVGYVHPLALGDELGAALPCVGLTAVALCNLAQVGRGSSVLVNGASGGVGHLALQVAKARGALVAATASARRRDLVAALGADEFIDYRARPVSDWPMAFDAVLDCVPNLPRASHRRLLRRGGHYASTLPNGWTYTLDPVLNRMGRLQRHAVMLQPDERAFDELLVGVSAGRLRCESAGVFPLEDAARAIELSQTGHVAGKIVIRVA